MLRRAWTLALAVVLLGPVVAKPAIAGLALITCGDGTVVRDARVCRKRGGVISRHTRHWGRAVRPASPRPRP